jgi:hypothetical protein
MADDSSNSRLIMENTGPEDPGSYPGELELIKNFSRIYHQFNEERRKIQEKIVRLTESQNRVSQINMSHSYYYNNQNDAKDDIKTLELNLKDLIIRAFDMYSNILNEIPLG